MRLDKKALGILQGKPKKKKANTRPAFHGQMHCRCVGCAHEWDADTGKRLWFVCPACGCRAVRASLPVRS